MSAIKLKALDTLFFKDGKPFSMGVDFFAKSVFPPSPAAFYGALRTAYFSRHPEDFKYANTKEDPTLSLEITGIYIQKINSNDSAEILFPLPCDLVKLKNNSDNNSNEISVYPLRINEKTKVYSSSPFENLLEYEKDEVVEYVSDGYLNEVNFRNYLKGNKENLKATKIKKYLEPKTGIARNNQTLISYDSKIYNLAILRLIDANFIVEYKFANGFEFDNGLLKFGAENKVAIYEKTEIKELPEFSNKIAENEKRFKIYLATPAIFKKGWLPEWIDEKSLKGKGLKLINAAIGKPLYVGGYDMKKNEPKPMMRAVPAGSVYYFEKENDSVDISSIFSSRSICDNFDDFDYGKMGYGLYYFAKM